MIIAVDHINPGFSKICQAEEEAQLDLFELAGLNDVLAHLLLPGVGKQLVLDAKLRRQKGVDKGNIVMDAADLKDFFPAQAELLIPFAPFLQIVAVVVVLAELAGVPALLDIAKKLDAELVGVKSATVGGHGPGVVVRIVNQLRWSQGLLRQDGGVPVRGPAFVDDLGLSLGREIIGLIADNR